ncbi:gustatory receptor for bitter taste 66a-like [Calliphora vicina]|uniref:gustatory receptor for bitter taste 66a-like n=1 Tax=Calliphora vicina TaxID=7373 RepID=UPI00325B78BC
MTAYRRKSSSIQTERTKPLLESFAVLFYLCKILGISSQDWEEFRKYKHLKRSAGGEGLVIIGTIILFINFNLMVAVFQSKSYLVEKDLLSLTIGLGLTYFSLAIFLADRVTGLWKQKCFINIFSDLEEIDEDFKDLNISFNNNYIKYRLWVAIVMTTAFEVLTFTVSFILFVDNVNWTAWLWIYVNIPTFLNTLDKLWYLGLLTAIKKRFEAINNAFNEEALKLERKRQKEKEFKLSKKIKKEKKIMKYTFKNQIRPVTKNFHAVFGDVVRNPQIFANSFDDPIPAISPPRLSSTSSDSSTYNAPVYTSLEERFVKLCQLHDTLCNVGKQLNEVYAFPILMLMGYGFFIVTAQLYFFYCSQVDQVVPALFRPAQSWWLTVIYILYISSKCVFILFGNWLTNLESKMTGICIHRCALADDKNDTYEMINHLSLKLFNHPLNFNACGYFPLNMTTLFSFCGGITTYLIILIQFNLEEQQVKSNSDNGKPMALTMLNDTSDDSMTTENVVNGTRSENATSLLTMFYYTWNEYFKNV